MRLRSPLAVLAVLAALAAPAAAEEADPTLDAARAHFDRAQDLFDKDDFTAASEEFLRAHATKPFPAFLYNAAVCQERLRNYGEAASLFERYLGEAPNARDRDEVTLRVRALRAAAAALAPPATEPALPPATEPATGPATQPGSLPATEPASQPASAPATQPEPPAPPPPPIAALPKIAMKGVVIISSKPAGATLYLDDRKAGPVGTTPWNGSLEGEHTLIVEARGFKPERKVIAPSSDKMVDVYIALSEDTNLGWLEVRSNVPAADVFLDRADTGAVGRTPYMGNVLMGPHRIIVAKEGFGEVVREVVVEPGKALVVDVKLDAAPVGFISVRGADNASVTLDGRVVCVRSPCRFPAPPGPHTVAVGRHDTKTMTRRVVVERTTETTLQVSLAPRPGKGDVIWPLALAAISVGGGAYLGTLSDDLLAELQADINDGDPPIGPDDTRFRDGKLLAWSADAAYVLGGIFAIAAVVSLFSDSGPSSTSTAESRPLTLVPAVGPNYAGVGAEVQW